MKFPGIQLILIPLLLVFACDLDSGGSGNPPELSNMVVTSTSFREATDTVYTGDSVYVSVDVTDEESDAAVLTMEVLTSSGETAVKKEYGDYAIYDSSVWKMYFETGGMTAGTYTIRLSAADQSANAGNVLTKNLSITASPNTAVSASDLTINIAGWTPAASGEPFTINYSIRNNSSVEIDRIHTTFRLLDVSSNVLDREEGVICGLGAGETKTDSVGVSTLNSSSVNDVDFDPDVSIVIY